MAKTRPNIGNRAITFFGILMDWYRCSDRGANGVLARSQGHRLVLRSTGQHWSQLSRGHGVVHVTPPDGSVLGPYRWCYCFARDRLIFAEEALARSLGRRAVFCHPTPKSSTDLTDALARDGLLPWHDS